MTQEQFDTYMARLDSLADSAMDKIDLSTFNLTTAEKATLESMPEELIAVLDDALARHYVSDADKRRKMCMKVLVQAWSTAPELIKAMKAGYEANQ